MHGIILAGEGSRADEHATGRPTPFLELDGRTLYERQREVLAPHVDRVTVVLGSRADAAGHELDPRDRALRLDERDAHESGESLRRGLDEVRPEAGERDGASADGVVVLDGDVLVAPSVLEELRRRHDETSTSVVGCLPGRQDEQVAIRCDRVGRVTDCGMIPGHRPAGVGIIDGGDVTRAVRLLGDHRSERYPVIYPELGTRRAFVPDRYHVEIGRPADLRAARRRLPFEGDTGGRARQFAGTGNGESLG